MAAKTHVVQLLFPCSRYVALFEDFDREDLFSLRNGETSTTLGLRYEIKDL